MAEQKQKLDASETIKKTVYPYYSLKKAIELAELVRDAGGVNGEVPKSVLAQHMKTDEGSPTLNGILGAAKLFRLVDGRGSYQLTDVAKRYFLPVTDHDQRMALLEMVNGPPLFRSLITQFDGTRIPSQSMLLNILHRTFGISESWRVRVASFFISTLQHAGVIDQAGFLRYSASIHAASNGTIPAMNTAPPVVSPPIDRPPAATMDQKMETKPVAGVAGWTYRGIRVDVPENLSMELWKKLSDYVNVLKPDEQ